MATTQRHRKAAQALDITSALDKWEAGRMEPTEAIGLFQWLIDHPEILRTLNRRYFVHAQEMITAGYCTQMGEIWH